MSGAERAVARILLAGGLLAVALMLAGLLQLVALAFRFFLNLGG